MSSSKIWKGMKFRQKVRYAAMRLLVPLKWADFDPDFYLQVNPDVAAAGADPLGHWIRHGRKEGRPCSPKQLPGTKDAWEAGGLAVQSGKPTLLLVSHEASRTGAPILCLSLARHLRDRYNIAILLLRDGPLTPHFRSASVRIAVADAKRDADLSSVIWSLRDPALRVDAAIVNSIVSYPVLSYLKLLNVPSLMLIHEYAAYCKPLYPFESVVKFSNKVVFSAPTTKANAIEEMGELPILTQAMVLPQGQCVAETDPVNATDVAEQTNMIARALDKSAGDTLVVVGAGSVNIRKGVDVFIQVAASMRHKVPDGNFKFVWVGGGYEPDKDQGYSVYLAEQVKRSGLTDCFEFLGEVADIQQVYDRTDVFLMTSRLDPLPNVGIDAICNGLPIFCFQEASGIADILVQQGYGGELVAPYLDPHAMANQVLTFARTSEQRAELRQRLKLTATQVFSMDRYAQILGDEANALLSSDTLPGSDLCLA